MFIDVLDGFISIFKLKQLENLLNIPAAITFCGRLRGEARDKGKAEIKDDYYSFHDPVILSGYRFIR